MGHNGESAKFLSCPSTVLYCRLVRALVGYAPHNITTDNASQNMLCLYTKALTILTPSVLSSLYTGEIMNMEQGDAGHQCDWAHV